MGMVILIGSIFSLLFILAIIQTKRKEKSFLQEGVVYYPTPVGAVFGFTLVGTMFVSLVAGIVVRILFTDSSAEKTWIDGLVFLSHLIYK
ncbi:hypothetical protein MNB_SV-3-989 [hydrothermal vent metagenome]|uniref:Uncharacterized protein n=1 Tax=hydrothermal vent metagenome TaxID=652676 RepID=A0A1W1BXN4_9ZZZZ